MTQEQIIEGNKLIAEFMATYVDEERNFGDLICPWYGGAGVSWNIYNKGKLIPKLQYHSSWNWLMPVIGKISVNCEEPEELDNLKYALLCNDINTAWSFVVDYLSN